MVKGLRIFALSWTGLVILVNLLAVVGTFLTAPSVWAWWDTVSGWYSTRNFWNVLAELLLLSPALVAVLLADRLARRAR